MPCAAMPRLASTGAAMLRRRSQRPQDRSPSHRLGRLGRVGQPQPAQISADLLRRAGLGAQLSTWPVARGCARSCRAGRAGEWPQQGRGRSVPPQGSRAARPAAPPDGRSPGGRDPSPAFWSAVTACARSCHVVLAGRDLPPWFERRHDWPSWRPSRPECVAQPRARRPG